MILAVHTPLVEPPPRQVEVSLEISATIPDGVPENVRRTVEENCRTLKFESHGFEEE